MPQRAPLLKLVVLDDYQGAAARFGQWHLIDREVEVTVIREHIADEEELIRRLRPFHIVCAMRERTPLPKRVIESLPSLKLIVTTGMWNVSVAIDDAFARGILVCGTESVQTGTPELTWLLILALARHFEEDLRSVRSGGWQTQIGLDLYGRSLGLLGLGKIGTRVAAVANAFGMHVLAWSQSLTTERAAAGGATYVDKRTLFAESDFVSVHLKLSERTRHIVAHEEFSVMKRTAFLVNTSRGALVAEEALVDALRNRRIAGAALDAFDIEPLPAGHPFRTLPNVLATPHVGYVTEATYEMFYRQMAENVRAWLDGRPVRRLISGSTAGEAGLSNVSNAAAST